MTDDDNDTRPMSIKAIPNRTRALMTACASRRGQTVGQWLATAVEHQAAIEQADRIEDSKFTPPPAVIPAALPGDTPVTPVAGISMGELAEAMRALAAIADTSGVPVPKTLARNAYALVNQRLRVVRGMPAVKPGKTRPQIGHTDVDAAP